MIFPSTARFSVTRDPNRPPVIKDNTGLFGSGPDVLAYISDLKVGEEVIEVGHSCMQGMKGIVYLSKDGGDMCARWDIPEGKMGTSITWGTRRVSDTSTEPSKILEVMYRATPDAEPREFAHVWPIHGWAHEDEGRWTFNRGEMCLANKWWIAKPKHDTLAALLDHLEATFVEGVPANRPD